MQATNEKSSNDKHSQKKSQQQQSGSKKQEGHESGKDAQHESHSGGIKHTTTKTTKKVLKDKSCANCAILEAEIHRLRHCDNCKYLQQRIDEYQAELARGQQKIKQLQDCPNCEEMNKNYQNALKEIGELNTQVIKLKNCQNCQDLQDQNAHLNEELDVKLNEIRKLQNCKQCAEYRKQLQKMQEEIEYQQEVIEEYQDCKQCKEYENKLNEQEQQMKKLNDEIEDLKNCDNCKEKDKELENLKGQIQKKDQKIEDQKTCNECEAKDKKIKEFEDQKDKNKDKIEQLEKQNQQIRITTQMEENNEGLKKQIQDLQDQLKRERGQGKDKQNQIDILNKQIENQSQPEHPNEIHGTLPMSDHPQPQQCNECPQIKEELKSLKRMLGERYLPNQSNQDCGTCGKLIDLLNNHRQDNVRQQQPQITQNMECKDCKNNNNDFQRIFDQLQQIKKSQQENGQQKQKQECDRCDQIFGLCQNLMLMSKGIYEKLQNMNNQRPDYGNDNMQPFQNERPVRSGNPYVEPIKSEPRKQEQPKEHKCDTCDKLKKEVETQQKDNKEIDKKLKELEDKVKDMEKQPPKTVIRERYETTRNVTMPPKTNNEYKESYYNTNQNEVQRVTYTRPAQVQQGYMLNTQSSQSQYNKQHQYDQEIQQLQNQNRKLQKELDFVKQTIDSNKQNQNHTYSQTQGTVVRKVYSNSVSPNEIYRVSSSQNYQCNNTHCQQQLGQNLCNQCSSVQYRVYCIPCKNIHCQDNSHDKVARLVSCQSCNLTGCNSCQICLCDGDLSISCNVCKGTKIQQHNSHVTQTYKNQQNQIQQQQQKSHLQNSYNLSHHQSQQQLSTDTNSYGLYSSRVLYKEPQRQTVNNIKHNRRVSRISLNHQTLNNYNRQKQLKNSYQQAQKIQYKTYEPLYQTQQLNQSVENRQNYYNEYVGANEQNVSNDHNHHHHDNTHHHHLVVQEINGNHHHHYQGSSYQYKNNSIM